jgi:hypothetical protein
MTGTVVFKLNIHGSMILPLLDPVQVYRATTRPNVHSIRVTSDPEAHVVRAQVVPNKI